MNDTSTHNEQPAEQGQNTSAQGDQSSVRNTQPPASQSPQSGQTAGQPVSQQSQQPQQPQGQQPQSQQSQPQQPQSQPQGQQPNWSQQQNHQQGNGFFPSKEQIEELWRQAQREADMQQRNKSGNNSKHPSSFSSGQKVLWFFVGFLLDIFSIPLVFIVYAGRDRTQRAEALKWSVVGLCAIMIVYLLVYTLIDPNLIQEAAMGGFGSTQGSASSNWTSSNF